MADDFPSIACHYTIPFAAQMKGGSLLDAVDDYHKRADKAPILIMRTHPN